MRKGLIVLLAAVLVAALALPAMADTSISGYYRAKGYVSNFKKLGAASTTPDADTQEKTYTYVEQRIRMKFEFGTENVKAVWFAEADPNFGIGNASTKNGAADALIGTTGVGAVGVARNKGGALGADIIDVETKNMYLWFKVPDTSWAVTVGLQNLSDSYAGVLFGASDMAGVFATFKYEPVDFRIGWSKWFEGDVGEADDIDLYLAEAKFVPAKDVKLGLNFYFVNDRGATERIATSNPTIVLDDGNDTGSLKVYTIGTDFAAKAGPAALTGFFLYQTGTHEDGTPGVADIDVAAFAGNLRADMALGPGKVFLEGLYVSGGDTPGTSPGQKRKSILTAGEYAGSQDYYWRTDMQILLSSIDDLSTNQPLTTNVSFGGRGVTHFAAGYSQKFSDKISGKIGVGYLAATKKFTSDAAFKGKGIGTEVNANVNYNIAKGLDFGLYGAYAFLGDFYDQAPGSPDLVDPYDLHFRLNYSY